MSDSLPQALGKVPSGLFILTIRHGSDETGMLASWVQQCSFDPPHVTVAVQRGRSAYALLADGGPFVLNQIGEGQSQFLKHFGKGFAPGESAFEGLRIERTVHGTPYLVDSVARLECRVVGRADGGDHELIIGRVEGGAVHQAEARPWVHIRKNGLGY